CPGHPLHASSAPLVLRAASPPREPTYSSEEDPSEDSHSQLPPIVAAASANSNHEGIHLATRVSSPQSTQPTPAANQLGGPSSTDPYVTATRASDRYLGRTPVDPRVCANEPRPPLARKPQVFTGIPVGFGLAAVPQDRMRIDELTARTNTNTYQLDLQSETQFYVRRWMDRLMCVWLGRPKMLELLEYLVIGHRALVLL
nr:hypothetical protein [Tanacetum cinerariifolium]